MGLLRPGYLLFEKGMQGGRPMLMGWIWGAESLVEADFAAQRGFELLDLCS